MSIEQAQPDPDGWAHPKGNGENREGVASSVRNAGAEAASQGREQAETARNRAAQGVDHTAEAVRGAAERLREQEPWLADLVSRGADELGQLADTLRTNDLRSMLGRTEDLARRQPMLVAGAAFAAGFAAMRAVRSVAASTAGPLSDVAGDAMDTVKRETKHAVTGAQEAAAEAAGGRPEQQQPGRDDAGAETRSTGLGH